MAKGALDGLRVVELGNFLAAPYCTMILADLGAEVIKIEPPGMGDSGRKTPPFVNGESAGFMSVNRNKLGVTTNLKTEAGVEIARRLAASSDVLVENLRLGTLAGFGLGYEDLSKLNQGLVYCSCSGFGQEGSHRDRAGLDLIGQGMSGIISVTGEPGGAPMRPGIPVVDLMTATFAACSILAALQARSASGKGQYIDIDLFSTGLAASPWETAQYLATGEIPGPLGSAHRILAPYQVFAASDGHFTVGVVSQRLWLKFCRIAGLEYLIEDPRFADNAARKAHESELAGIIDAVTRKRPLEDWLADFEEAGIPAGPINDYGRALADPQVRANRLVQEVDSPVSGRQRVVGPPYRLSETPASVRSAAPGLGEHNDEVLTSIGYEPAEIDALRRQGVI